MLIFSLVVSLLLAADRPARPALVVQAPDSPVRMAHVTILTPSDGPPVVLYEATNLTDEVIDQFTVMVFVFNSDGDLKARQVAPARRTLDARGSKYSALVLDGSPIDSTDAIVVGVNQAQRVNSEVWWRADLQVAAETAVPRKKR
jgi:hypothetical protein